jgi:hypothetical protein
MALVLAVVVHSFVQIRIHVSISYASMIFNGTQIDVDFGCQTGHLKLLQANTVGA